MIEARYSKVTRHKRLRLRVKGCIAEKVSIASIYRAFGITDNIRCTVAKAESYRINSFTLDFFASAFPSRFFVFAYGQGLTNRFFRRLFRNNTKEFFS